MLGKVGHKSRPSPIGQIISSGIQGTALDIWQHSASASFVPCLAYGHQPASATTTSRREIEAGITEVFADASLSLFYRLSCMSFFLMLSHKRLTGGRTWARQRSKKTKEAECFRIPIQLLRKVGHKKSSQKQHNWTQMIWSGIQRSGLDIWNTSAVVSFALCLACGQ